jgi:hypothetical protein
MEYKREAQVDIIFIYQARNQLYYIDENRPWHLPVINVVITYVHSLLLITR